MSGEFTDLFAVAACGAMVAVAEAVTIPLLRRAAIIDVPGLRSFHTVPTPGGGGIPVAAGLLGAAVLIRDVNAAVFAFAVAALGLLGFADDLRGLTRGWRLIVQAVGGTIADTTWTLLRRIRAGERWLEVHRTHVYQRWCDAGWSHQRMTVTAAVTNVLLSLLGAASLAGDPALRAAADLSGAVVVVTYVRSPALLARRLIRAEAS